MKAYESGDLVIYGSHGVCKIVGIEAKRIDHKTVEYYVLTPIQDSASHFYIPVNNELAVSKLRPTLSKKEILQLLQSDDVRQNVWIEDENLRKQRYKELILGNDLAALISMIRALHLHKEKQEIAGRKFHLCDENFLRDAKKLLGGEFALSLGLSDQEIEALVKQYLE